jgi:hypothetical protein
MDSTSKVMGRRASIFIGLAIWQLVNATGFFSAMWEERKKSNTSGSKVPFSDPRACLVLEK